MGAKEAHGEADALFAPKNTLIHQDLRTLIPIVQHAVFSTVAGPSFRQTAFTVTPLPASFRIPTIWLSLYCDRFKHAS